MADLSALLPDADVLWEGDNVIELPNLVSGPLADLLAAAGAEGYTWEVGGEAKMRHDFRVAATEWPSSRRHPRRASAAFAASLVAGMILATTGLAAATGLPLPTTHLVDQAINQFNHDLASPPASVPLTGLRHRVTPVRYHPAVHGAATVHALRHVPEASASACPSGTTAGGSATTCVTAPSAVSTASGSATVSAGTVKATLAGTHAASTPTSTGGTHKTSTGGTHKTSTGGNHGTAGGGGTSTGGNHGTGGGGGSSRGGNHGTGGGHCPGVASSTTAGAASAVQATSGGMSPAASRTCGGSGHHHRSTPPGQSGQTAEGGNGTGSSM